MSSIPTTCKMWTKCQSDSDCNGGTCLQFSYSGKFCSCNTKSQPKLTISTTLFTTEIKCVNGNRCETNADCNGGNCFNFFGLPDGKFCKCEQATSTPLMPTFNPSISNTMLCTQWAKCEYDMECNGGKCKTIFGIGKLCSCEATPSTCVNYHPCTSDQNCPGGKCVRGRRIPDNRLMFDYCQCGRNSMQTTPKPVTTITKSTTTAMRTETLYPIHPHPLFCITNNTCDSDEDCPGGACKKHSKSGV